MFGEAELGLVRQREIQRRPRRDVIQDVIQLDIPVELGKYVDAFLQPLGETR